MINILIIEHKHGRIVSAHDTEAEAKAELCAYCFEWFERETGKAPPDDPEACVAAYFEAAGMRESFEIVTADYAAPAPIGAAPAGSPFALEESAQPSPFRSLHVMRDGETVAVVSGRHHAAARDLVAAANAQPALVAALLALLADFRTRNAEAQPPRNPYAFESVRNVNRLLTGEALKDPAPETIGAALDGLRGFTVAGTAMESGESFVVHVPDAATWREAARKVEELKGLTEKPWHCSAVFPGNVDPVAVG